MNLSFANPYWVHLLWLVAAIAGLVVWLEFHGSARLGGFISRAMQDRLVNRPTIRRRLLKTGMFALVGVSLTFAMMRPQWGLQYIESRQVGAEIMVCLDVSKSMLAEDVAPNRLERAKAEIGDLVSMMEDDHVGLIAFAGKATVLSPMTPDRGFLKLIMSHAGPGSVARGGTNLEAPIRKALAGFRSEADISRVILLITDGEDHDSFPLDAAKVAAERGIRIIAIGFGDEGGSEITITDAKTGVRKAMVDSTGKPIVSRLDGKMLRDIALATEGVYVPAGTGALNLRSIYDAHIAPLMRANLVGKGRMVRNEAFQWCIVGAIVFTVLGALVSGGRRAKTGAVASPRSAPSTTVRAGAAFLAVVLVGRSVSAQSPAPTSLPAGSNAPPAAADDESEPGPGDPRELYNNGVAFLESGRLDSAERSMLNARSSAATDGEVRYRATFNLGWVDVRRANGLIKDKPAEALKHLQAAADRFRDAVRLRPRQDEPRTNLELVSRRILELADSLRKERQGDLAKRLDTLISAQRGRLAGLGAMVQLAAERSNQTNLLRKEFRELGVQQRQALSEILDVTESARREHDAIEAIEPDKQSPRQRVRMAQLRGVLNHIEMASQRVGQGRSQLRRRQAERAYRRIAASLDALKRARDQLRNPAEILGALITDTAMLMRYTGASVAAEGVRIPATTTQPDGERNKPSIPAWLTVKYLQQTQEQITERTVELRTRLAAGVSQLKDHPASQPDARQKKKFLEILQAAAPLIAGAAEAFERAGESLMKADLKPAFNAQGEGLTSLIDARELFLDMRGLIEAMYGDEKRIEAVLKALKKQQDKSFEEYLEMIRESNSTNRKRADRVDGMLDDALSEIGQSATTQPQSDPQQKASQKQQLETAKSVLAQIRDEWSKARQLLEDPKPSPDNRPETMRLHVNQNIERLELLRRLFFTLIEHLRDTLRRQVDLNDRTQRIADDPNADQTAGKTAPLAEEQNALAGIADQIAKALDKQSRQGVAQQPGATSDPKAREQQRAAAERLAEAADKVSKGHNHMISAAKNLSPTDDKQKLDIKPARAEQDQAAERLAEALALLNPPKQQPQKDKQQKNQDKQGQDKKPEDSKDEADKKQRQMSASGMLQAIRDREQQRRRDRNKKQAGRYESVDKDW